MITKEKFFPNSTIGEVTANGMELGQRAKGVTVTLTWEEGAQCPRSAEVEGGEHYAEIGLEWEYFYSNSHGDYPALTGYDGAFDLPNEVEQFLRELGFAIQL